MNAVLPALLLSLAAASAQTPAPVPVTVGKEVVQEHFLGVGFHGQLFMDSATPEYFEQVVSKRWRELNPAFARVFHHAGPSPDGGSKKEALDTLARELVFMKEATGTEVYMTTGRIRATAPGEERQAYVREMIDDVQYLRDRGATNLKYYGSSNELTMKTWGDLRDDMPTYRDYQRLVFEELKRRHLEVKLLATDASPILFWNTIEWAAENMDDVTDIYGGHHYANGVSAADLDFYEWFRGKCAWAVDLARARGKDFILGEFGSGQYLWLRWGIRWDGAEYYDTPQEPQAGLQVAEASLAAINAGVYAMGYWTFTDYPDRSPARYVNQWGLFKSATQGAAIRAPYYSYGLLTKYLHGPARVFKTASPDPNVRVAVLQRTDGAGWSVAVINRNTTATLVSIQLPADPGKLFRKYVYDPARVPVTEDGDLQEPSGRVVSPAGKLTDTVAANSLALYTTAYDDVPPAPVQGLEVTPMGTTAIPNMPVDAQKLTWKASPESDLCYYRIYRGDVRIGSAVSNSYVDASPMRDRTGAYRVVAVDKSGNPSQ